MNYRALLLKKINPLYGVLIFAIVILTPIGLLVRNYLSDTATYRQQLYRQAVSECGGKPYIIPVKPGILGEQYNLAVSPNAPQPQYDATLHKALAAHAPYEFKCSGTEPTL